MSEDTNELNVYLYCVFLLVCVGIVFVATKVKAKRLMQCIYMHFT